ncbi:MAG: hypothetical protein A2513_07785 [Sulfurimonas sp. RIFOXYD12_FULL_33_39]|uniref:hypothetical protein n=1 Tax=unclassified Sulfurimonas TaxID=2623549 RepID=UPI0008AFCC08|nr:MULTISPECIES: hypothetical protein [unclassified Sulfurimonas]OHE06521.1 MAG: hypothetical protein A3G74_02010 [Sulfurimonas sp. RIFCSPLOWO2_12_FULL_34_6]OHE09993.1 MAG: hypothetical protein A2513_07785 [Sulfurimonas sp. RIFOXYD12_FULL_33_39]OHE14787.1 MAG: hypothetical protein A2530_02695 [Sulfurimonas sp. RIFOXYD2_FULL_34_21]DAB28830.1 MAG TPA: hypothetical protein CFH78_00315 [Sulfurimonas sp. UBA10385]
MLEDSKKILALLDYVKIDKYSVVCCFKCNVKNKSVVSVVPFEPFDGKIEISLKEMIFHPINSYNRYYHTPITIYGDGSKETIVLKAFKKVAHNFEYDELKHKYIYCNKR